MSELSLLKNAVTGEIEVGEYALWLPVAAAIAEARADHVDILIFQDRLRKRLQDDEVAASVESIQASHEGDVENAYFRRIAAWVWVHASHGNEFWQLSEADSWLPYIPSSRSIHFTLRGVRFRPDDIGRLLGRPVVPVPRPLPKRPLTVQEAYDESANKVTELLERLKGKLEGVGQEADTLSQESNPLPKVGRKELETWVAQFGNRNPGAPFSVFLANGKLAFPHHRVTERPLKAAIAKLGLTLSPGNPRITQKNR